MESSRKFEYHDIPPIYDQNVYYHLFLLQQIITPIQELQRRTINAEAKSRTSLGLVLPIINRSLEITTSMITLLSRNRIRDASVLFLNLYELKLDLMYISIDPTRENTWIDCNTKNKKPWKVRSQQNEIFKSEGELNAEIKMYRDYSMIKHGNNAGSYNSFKFSINGNKMIVDKMEGEMIIPQIINLGGTLASVAKAGIEILENNGTSIEDLYSEIDNAYWELRNVITDNLESMVYRLVFEKYPHLKDIADIKNKLRIEINNGENEEELQFTIIIL